MADRDRFLAELEQDLTIGATDRATILEELRGHIEDTAAGLEAAGAERSVALRQALDRLGPASLLADQLVAVHRPHSLRALAAGGWRSIASSGLLGIGVLGTAAVGFGAVVPSGLTDGRLALSTATAPAASTADPNLVFILVAAGIAGLLFELVHPNLATGLTGGVALLAGLAAAGSLPLNTAGVLLLAVSLGVLFLEAHVPSQGLLTGLGLIGFVAGATVFYAAPATGQPAVEVSWPVIAVAAAIALAFASVIVGAAVRLRRMKPTVVAPGLGWTGVGMIGAVGEVHHDLDPIGSIHVAGEEWSARLPGGPTVRRGLHVRVVGQDHLTLVVMAIE